MRLPWLYHGGQRAFTTGSKALLAGALALRDRRAAGAVSQHGLAIARGRLEYRLEDMLAMRLSNATNARFQAHLRKHRDELFTFLYDARFDATNWRAGQAIRHAVVNRKVFGGNRTIAGAHALEVLASLFATCRQHSQDAFLRRCAPSRLSLSILLRTHPASLNPLPLPIPQTRLSARR